MSNGDMEVQIPQNASWNESRLLIFNLLIAQGRSLKEVTTAVRQLQTRMFTIGLVGSFVGMVVAKVFADYVLKMLPKVGAFLGQIHF